MKCYIAGPMRGHKNFNREAFYRAEELLRNLGYKIFNPCRNDEEKGISLESEHGDFDEWVSRNEGVNIPDIVREDLNELQECNAIYMLKGWGKSTGALAEYHVAKWLGLEVMYESE